MTILEGTVSTVSVDDRQVDNIGKDCHLFQLALNPVPFVQNRNQHHIWMAAGRVLPQGVLGKLPTLRIDVTFRVGGIR